MATITFSPVQLPKPLVESGDALKTPRREDWSAFTREAKAILEANMMAMQKHLILQKFLRIKIKGGGDNGVQMVREARSHKVWKKILC